MGSFQLWHVRERLHQVGVIISLLRIGPLQYTSFADHIHHIPVSYWKQWKHPSIRSLQRHLYLCHLLYGACSRHEYSWNTAHLSINKLSLLFVNI